MIFHRGKWRRGYVQWGVWAIAAAGMLALPLAAAENSESRRSGIENYRELLRAGTLSNNLGRYGKAEGSFREAFAVCEEILGEGHPDCGDALLRIGLEISNQIRFEEAGLVFERAESLVKKAGEPLDFPRLQTYQAMNLANQSRFDEAFALVAEANQRRKGLIQTNMEEAGQGRPGAKKRLKRTMSDLAHGLFVQATLSFQRGKIGEAEVMAHLTRRLILKVEGVPDWWTANVDELLARIDVRLNRPEAAEKRLKLALETKRLALGNTRAVAQTHLLLGSVYRMGRKNPLAMKTMRPGLAIVRNELGEVPGVTFGEILPFLEAAHAEAQRDAARRDDLYAEMFGVSQLIRTGSTARTIAKVAARFASSTPRIADIIRRSDEAARRRDRLRVDLGRESVTRGGTGRKKRLNELRQAFRASAAEALRLEKEIAVAFPDYARLITTVPVQARELGALLRPDEALIQISIGEEGSFGFVVRRGRLAVAPLNINHGEAVEAVKRLRAPFEKAGGQILPFDMAASHELYGKLIKPFQSLLAGVRHLIVVPSGALLSLPFSLLITRSPAELGANEYGRAAWLAEDMATSIMPSARAFADLRALAKPSSAPRPFIGFGDPAFGGAAGGGGMDSLASHCQVGSTIPVSLIQGLAPLPGTADEVRTVAKSLGASAEDIYLGRQMTEENLRRLPLDQYRTVYFATHGLLPGELKCQSEPALVLSPPLEDTGDRSRDGLLDGGEIAALRLDADLVVLSACNTGGGGSGDLGGEALSGLVRSFFQAGARSLLVSHWQVDTVATARLMIDFFDRLGPYGAPGGRPGPAQALQGARVRMIGDPRTAHPFFWAAFTLIGAGSAVSAS